MFLSRTPGPHNSFFERNCARKESYEISWAELIVFCTMHKLRDKTCFIQPSKKELLFGRTVDIETGRGQLWGGQSELQRNKTAFICFDAFQSRKKIRTGVRNAIKI